MSNIMDLDLVSLIRRLDEGSVSARAVTEVCLRRIEQLDPKINAFSQLDTDGARAQAAISERRQQRIGPLDGVPVAVKDNIDIKGLITRSGLGPRAERPAEKDADIVSRMRAAGAVVLGHLNMHEGALGATTDNPHHGRTHNPHRLGYTPAGSSGGSAASVAARLCPLALGTDTMGSVRLPAAYCGIVGFKPSHGLLGNDGIEPLCRRLDQVGPMARSVSDIRRFFEALNVLPKPRGTTDLSVLRIGRLIEFDDAEFSDDVRRAFANAYHRLGQAGIEVLDLSMPDFDPGKARRAGLLLAESEAAATFAADRERYPAAFSSGFAKMLDYGAGATEERLRDVEGMIDTDSTSCDRLFETVDLIVAPTAPQTAFSFEDDVPANQADLTALANFAGAPAISIPIPSADLPVGLQLIGRRGADALVLHVAELMEQDLCFRIEPLSLEDLA